MHKKTHIIIGTSAAGLSAARMLARLEKESTIICISQEAEQPYNKCFLADYLSGETTWENVQTTTVESARTQGITMRLGATVIGINKNDKQVILDSGELLSYDTLFIATGSSPFIPHINGLDSVDNKYTFHTAEDAKALLLKAKQSPGLRTVVVGAGLSGLECADSLATQGSKVTVLERSEHILSRQIDQKGANYIQSRMNKLGISLYQDVFIDRIEQKNGEILVCLSSGDMLQADMVVIATGVRPNGEIAEKAELEMLWGGIVVNEYMQTSSANIYAGGDVAVVKDVLSGKKILSCSWPDASLQGVTAARAMAGVDKKYPGVALVTSTSFFDLKFASCGQVAAPPVDCAVIERSIDGGYQKLLIKNKRLIGFLVIGPKTYLTTLKRAILTSQIVEPDELLK